MYNDFLHKHLSDQSNHIWSIVWVTTAWKKSTQSHANTWDAFGGRRKCPPFLRPPPPPGKASLGMHLENFASPPWKKYVNTAQTLSGLGLHLYLHASHHTVTDACMHACIVNKWCGMRCQTEQALSLTIARADHRCIVGVRAIGKPSANATIQVGLRSSTGPAPLPLPAWSLSKGSSPYRQYGISIPQLTTDHLCFFDVPWVVTDSLPLTTAVHFHTAFVLVSATNKTNIRGRSWSIGIRWGLEQSR